MNQYSEEGMFQKEVPEKHGKSGILCRVLALLYVIGVYASTWGFVFFRGEEEDPTARLALNALVWLACLLINLKNYDRIDRLALLDAVMIVKYLLMPFFFINGCLTVLTALMSFIPVPFMLFVAPMMAVFVGSTNWCFMVSCLIFSVPYLWKARKEKVYGEVFMVFGIISQLIWGVDVIMVIVLSFREKRGVLASVCLIILTLLLVFGSIAWLIFKIVTR